MASISDFGIACARPMAALAALSLGVGASAQAPTTTDLTIEIAGLRDAKGVVRLCLTADPRDFPDCKGRDAVAATVKASRSPIRYTFRAVPAGNYAIASFHDANGNGKLDTMLGIPKEGFAFSRNPALKPRAPRLQRSVVPQQRLAVTVAENEVSSLTIPKFWLKSTILTPIRFGNDPVCLSFGELTSRAVGGAEGPGLRQQIN